MGGFKLLFVVILNAAGEKNLAGGQQQHDR